MRNSPVRLAAALLGASALSLLPVPGRAAEPSLRDRMAVERALRGETLRVLADERLGWEGSFLQRGKALAALGLSGEAATDLTRVLLSPAAPQTLWEEALTEFLSLPPGSGTLAEIPLHRENLLRGRNAYLLGGRYLDSGRGEGLAERGIALLRRAREDADAAPLAALLLARWESARGNGPGALEALAGIRDREGPSSDARDLAALQRGYLHLSQGDTDRARQAFLQVGPESPYSPESQHGLAWTHIRDGDLAAGVVRLEGLLAWSPNSTSARKGALDLALCYRQLGLFDKASDLLTREVRRLEESQQGLASLLPRDFAPGRDLAVLVDAALGGVPPPPAVLERTPPFARELAEEAARDGEFRDLLRLLQGARRLEGEARDLKGRMARARAVLDSQDDWLTEKGEHLARERANLEKAGGALQSLLDRAYDTLQAVPLRALAQTPQQELLARSRSAFRRLALLQGALEKGRSFKPVIQEMTSAEMASREAKELKRIRESAFAGLEGNADGVASLRERVAALEGEIWIQVKEASVSFEEGMETRSRVVSAKGVQAGTRADRVARLLEDARTRVRSLRGQVQREEAALERVLSTRLVPLRESLFRLRESRLLALAAGQGTLFREAEALAVFTAADVETTRMEDRLRALQGRKP